MLEHDGPREPAEKRAERKWKNNQLRQKIIASKVPVPVVVDPNAPPEIATVIVNKAKRRPGGFERKFLKDIRAILDERKQENLELIKASLRHQRRRLMLEKLRRLELSVAESEKRIAERQNVAQEICERVSCGGLLIEICNEPHLPTARRFYQWLRDNADINALYKESIKIEHL